MRSPKSRKVALYAWRWMPSLSMMTPGTGGRRARLVWEEDVHHDSTRAEYFNPPSAHHHNQISAHPPFWRSGLASEAWLALSSWQFLLDSCIAHSTDPLGGLGGGNQVTWPMSSAHYFCQESLPNHVHVLFLRSKAFHRYLCSPHHPCMSCGGSTSTHALSASRPMPCLCVHSDACLGADTAWQGPRHVCDDRIGTICAVFDPARNGQMMEQSTPPTQLDFPPEQFLRRFLTSENILRIAGPGSHPEWPQGSARVPERYSTAHLRPPLHLEMAWSSRGPPVVARRSA